ncbi:uncharacterized protein LOC102681661, partial [Apis dorsata]|uniref:uncharacterized protein LOC102681661 n=1 Tax=Apis dorsata TaxID=7462 RepID=UPI0012930D35
AFFNVRPRSHVIYKQTIELARVRTSKRRQLFTLSCSDHVKSNSRGNEEMTSNLSKTEIAHTTRNKVSVERKISSKEILLPSGKENECPSAKNATIGGRKMIFTGDTICRTQRISSSSNRGIDQSKERCLNVTQPLSSNNELKKEVSNERSRTNRSLWNVSGKKMPFHVHCDDANKISHVCDSQAETHRISNMTSVDSIESHFKRGENLKQTESRKIMQKRSPPECRDMIEFPRSKIPCRVKSSSVRSLQTSTRIIPRRSISIETATSSHAQRFNFDLTEKSLIASRNIWKSFESGASQIENKIKDKSNEEKGEKNATKNFSRERSTLSERVATPIDEVPSFPAPSTPLRMINRQTNLKKLEFNEIIPSERNSSFCDLVFYMEYLDDVPMIEREREERSPRLSANFLTKHINPEQRRLVVAFMIRVGNHCRFPSYIVYQSVKLFDAVMDKLSVKTMFFQLTALASLWIALKKQENYYKIPTANTIVSLAQDLYTGRENLLMVYERKILHILDFNITFADAFSLFSHHLLSCIRYIDISNEMIVFLYHCGCYLIDITLIDEHFCRIPARLISLTIIELVLGLIDNTPRWLFWRGLLFAIIPRSPDDKFQDKEIDETRVLILRRVLHSGQKVHGFDMVYKKYNRSRYGRISQFFLELVTKLSSTEIYFDP